MTVPSVVPNVMQLRLCLLTRQSQWQQGERRIFLTLLHFNPSSPGIFVSCQI